MDPGSLPWPALCQKAPREKIRSILSTGGVDPKGCCLNGANAYFYAIQRRPEDDVLAVLKLLEEHGVDVSHSDKIKQTALFYAARDNKLDCCGFFLDRGVDAGQKDAYQQTALYYAAREGHVDVARLLVKHGAPVDSVDSLKGEPPLFYCASQGHKELVQVFLNEFHCDPLKQNKDGKTASAVARRANHKVVQSIIDNFIRQINTNKSAPNAPIADGATPSNEGIIAYPARKQYRLKMCGPLNEWMHPTIHKIQEFELRYPDISVWNRDAPLPTVKPSMDPFKARWHKLAVEILKEVFKYEGSEHFRAPVDVHKWNIRHYLDIVKKPMDFGTIRKKLSANEYGTLKSFLEEMELVFENCFLFNGKESEFGLIGLNVKSYFHNLATCKGIYLLSQQETEIEHDALRAIEQLRSEGCGKGGDVVGPSYKNCNQNCDTDSNNNYSTCNGSSDNNEVGNSCYEDFPSAEKGFSEDNIGLTTTEEERKKMHTNTTSSSVRELTPETEEISFGGGYSEGEVLQAGGTGDNGMQQRELENAAQFVIPINDNPPSLPEDKGTL